MEERISGMNELAITKRKWDTFKQLMELVGRRK
jgi:hypothetical protein